MSDAVVSCGTTIIAFKYKEGIVLAADSRTSSGTYIPCRITDKINAISDNIYCCQSGSAADTQIIIRSIRREINSLALLEHAKPSVKKTATLTSSIIYGNKEHMLAGIIVAGYDTEFQIYQISPDGSIHSGDIILGGSGSGFIYGYSDAHYRNDMSLSEAVEFAKCMIRLAINRDAVSGGVCRIAAIEKDKVTRYFLDGDKVFLE